MSNNESSLPPNESNLGSDPAAGLEITPAANRHSVAPNRLLDKETQLAQQAGRREGDWEYKHTKMLHDLRHMYEEHINKNLGNLQKRLTEPLNGWHYNKSKGLYGVEREVKRECKNLRDKSRRYANDKAKFDNDLQKLQESFPNIDERSIGKVTAKDKNDWILLIGVMLICIITEAAANVSLLASALDGGYIQAFTVAVLASFLNVAVLGAGVGLLFSFLHCKANKASRRILPFLVAAWLCAVLLLNLFFGHHREGFSRDAKQKEAAAEAAYEGTVDSEGIVDSLASAMDTSIDVSYNIMEWQFESFLFMGLGIGLCMIAFLKAYFFFRPGEHLSEELRELHGRREKIREDFESLSKKYQDELTNTRRKDVTQFVQDLEVSYRETLGLWEDVESNWENNRMVGHVEGEFAKFHNDNHGDKTNRDMLKEHREKVNIDLSFPATDADKEPLRDAREIIQEWNRTGKDEFFERIHQKAEDVHRLCEDYRRPVLMPLGLIPTEATHPDQVDTE